MCEKKLQKFSKSFTNPRNGQPRLGKTLGVRVPTRQERVDRRGGSGRGRWSRRVPGRVPNLFECKSSDPDVLVLVLREEWSDAVRQAPSRLGSSGSSLRRSASPRTRRTVGRTQRSRVTSGTVKRPGRSRSEKPEDYPRPGRHS